MTTLFYLLLIIPILFEIGTFESVEKILAFKKREDKKAKLTIKQSIFVLVNFFYFVLSFIGLLSSQWLLFAILILMGLLPKRYKLLMIADSIISLVILFFILLNHFHFHIDITAVFLNLFNK